MYNLPSARLSGEVCSLAFLKQVFTQGMDEVGEENKEVQTSSYKLWR